MRFVETWRAMSLLFIHFYNLKKERKKIMSNEERIQINKIRIIAGNALFLSTVNIEINIVNDATAMAGRTVRYQPW